MNENSQFAHVSQLAGLINFRLLWEEFNYRISCNIYCITDQTQTSCTIAYIDEFNDKISCFLQVTGMMKTALGVGTVGLLLAVQIVARRYDEEIVLRIMKELEDSK